MPRVYSKPYPQRLTPERDLCPSQFSGGTGKKFKNIGTWGSGREVSAGFTGGLLVGVIHLVVGVGAAAHRLVDKHSY